MKENIQNCYFAIIKLLGLIALTIWAIPDSDNNQFISLYVLNCAIFLFAAVMLELIEHRKWIRILLVMEGILSILAVFLFPICAEIWMVITILDLVCVLKKRFYYYAFAYLPLIISYREDTLTESLPVFVTLIIIFYLQEKIIISGLKQKISDGNISENRLKINMEEANIQHKDELRKSGLRYENEMLEEKGRITQALHDKLGHSINGSLYQLEAVKALMDKKPDQARQILQEVIDNLRTSMDEIRLILRRERPNKKRKALLALQALCDECIQRYEIQANLNVTDLGIELPETIWEIILDNTYEAVTNALKYSKCKKIDIDIRVLNQVVRCTIVDDGTGADGFEEGMGIQGMKQRVRSVKGFLDISTENGFMINMILPYHN